MKTSENIDYAIIYKTYGNQFTIYLRCYQTVTAARIV